MNVKTMKVADLHLAEKNVRRHPQKQLEEIQRSYKMFGQYRPLVVAADGEVLVGNGFLEAMQLLGEETVECIVLPENTSEKQKRKLMLADNKIFDLGADAMGNIDELLSQMQDFDIPGYDADILADLFAVPDDEEIPIPASALGVAPAEKIENIKQAEEKRAEAVVDDDPRKYEVRAEVVENHEQAEEGRPYITCPHCGVKIYGYN